jgi:outer membrane protein assembly factor BamA
VLPPSELRKRVPLDARDVFDLGKIRQGLEGLKRLYDSLGYINLTASSDIKIDDDHQSISAVVELEEDRQFRVGSVKRAGEISP